MNEVVLPAGVRGIVFDVGETPVDETHAWSQQAEMVGVTPFALMGVLGALIERGEAHRRVWEVLGVERPAMSTPITEADLYPDAILCLVAAKAAGLVVGIAGNQPDATEAELRVAGFRPDFIASSSAWAAAKPSPVFFDKIAAAAGMEPGAILYVGDRLDNDIVPAREAGMHTAFIRRGPWGYIHAKWQNATVADISLDSLNQLTKAFETKLG